jgi:hypothetical protein
MFTEDGKDTSELHGMTDFDSNRTDNPQTSLFSLLWVRRPALTPRRPPRPRLLVGYVGCQQEARRRMQADYERGCDTLCISRAKSQPLRQD